MPEPTMIFEEKDGLRLCRFPALEKFPDVMAVMSTRIGGVSEGDYKGLNLGLSTDDNPYHVEENRQRFWRALGVDMNDVIRQHQVHEDRVVFLQEQTLCADTDAMYTDQSKKFLTVVAADCVPVLFYEPAHRIIAVIHAGWRGTQKQIIKKTMASIQQTFGCSLGHAVAVLGPSIGADHYEVSDEVASMFDTAFVNRRDYPKPHLDLWKANAAQLDEAGVGHIVVTGACTMCQPDIYYSHRASGGRSGRMVGVIGRRN